jgi:hypothetical protein
MTTPGTIQDTCGAFGRNVLNDWTCGKQRSSRAEQDYLCPTCGILPFRRPSDLTPQERLEGVEPFDGWAINVRCPEGVDPESIPVRRIHGIRIQHGA